MKRKPIKDSGDAKSTRVSGQTRRDDVAELLREDDVMRALRRVARKAPLFQVDFDALYAELQEITRANYRVIATKTLQLGSVSSLLDLGNARLAVQAHRDRTTEIANELRSVAVKSSALWTQGSAWARQQPMLRSFSAAAIDDILSVAMREVGTIVDETESMLSTCEAVLRNIDSKTRTLDTWAGIYREYVFMSGSRPGSQDQSTRLGGLRKKAS